ncbi:flagellar hook capping FlgD N-terminal domain-containing protein [Paenibacillus albus]|uniref:Flagellar hook capping protein n=1 Tax=Paenibacillus albus TaxID=2495582 RepID=A0A3Q8X5Z3_9BACL|nr:flagellar hook capping FlgD N-terminal domain-containing protein [Paenibacillus albus]AZN40857.1 flagellar hook capping protein [Paenibacillus albus]
MSDRVSTTNVWPYYSSSNVQAATKKQADTSLGKDDFLRILVTQLQNQDPMQPLEDKDFIAQMAQFSSVEQLVNMSDQLTSLRQNLGMVSSMIGKNVQWYDYSDTGEMITKTGAVDSIVIKDKVQYARIGNTDVNLDDIVSIGSQGGEAASE